MSPEQENNDNIPFHLMPVAALLGMLAFIGVCRAVYIIYTNLTYDSLSRKTPPAITLDSNPFTMLCSLIVVAIAGYGKIVAKIHKAYVESEHALFDPYDILGISESDADDKSAVTSAYRELAKIYHPDKGGSQTVFMRIQYAYEALTDELGIQNFKKYGHPDGPVRAPSFELALPKWLVVPVAPPKVQAAMIFVYLGSLSLIFYLVIQALTKKEKSQAKATIDSNTVSLEDLGYLAHVLSASSTHYELLLAIASTPENIAWAQESLDRTEEIRKQALEEKKKEKNESKKASLAFDDLDDQGWDEDDDDEDEDENAKQAKLQAKKAEEEKKRQMEQLKKATGQVRDPLEGIDDGVLGQEWVMKTLAANGKWPPKDLSFLEDMKFDYKGKKVFALDHPGLKRNLCMTVGRINSTLLNTHPELLHAGEKKLLDQSYFKSNLEYRSRAGVLLEATLRLAIALRSYSLTKTIVETVAQFKVGCTGDNVEWFEGVLKREYGCLPHLDIKSKSIETPDEPEIATGDLCVITVELERTHAEKFTARKIEMFKKQGIPPQVAFQTFREGWWLLVTAERIDGEGKPVGIDKENAVISKVDAADIEKFENEKAENSLLQAWPMLVQNIAQKNGKAKLQFKTPSVPGKYRFHVSIKSQEFLGCDQEFSLEAEVIDIETLKRDAKIKAETPPVALKEGEREKTEESQNID